MSILEKFKSIKTFVFDVDGVMTDGGVQVFDTGAQLRTMNTKDGYCLQLAVKKGYRILVISGGSSEGVRLRLKKLGIDCVFLRVAYFLEELREFARSYGLDEDAILL